MPSRSQQPPEPRALLDRLDETLLGIRRVFMRPGYRLRLLEGSSRNLTLATLRLLRAIERSEGAPSVGEVAEALTIDPSTASRLVDAATESGLVERQNCADDRRSRRLHLTEEGTSALAEVTERRRQLLSHVTDGWSEEELEQLAGMLARLRAGFDELEER